jgi:hypothetical protein
MISALNSMVRAWAEASGLIITSQVLRDASTKKLEPYILLQHLKSDGMYCNSPIHYETAAFDKIYCNNHLAMKCNALSLLKSIAIATNAYAPAVPESSL